MRAIIPLRIQVEILSLQKYAKARLASRLLRKSKKKRKKIIYENHTRGVGKYEKKNLINIYMMKICIKWEKDEKKMNISVHICGRLPPKTKKNQSRKLKIKITCCNHEM